MRALVVATSVSVLAGGCLRRAPTVHERDVLPLLVVATDAAIAELSPRLTPGTRYCLSTQGGDGRIDSDPQELVRRLRTQERIDTAAACPRPAAPVQLLVGPIDLVSPESAFIYVGNGCGGDCGGEGAARLRREGREWKPDRIELTGPYAND